MDDLIGIIIQLLIDLFGSKSKGPSPIPPPASQRKIPPRPAAQRPAPQRPAPQRTTGTRQPPAPQRQKQLARPPLTPPPLVRQVVRAPLIAPAAPITPTAAAPPPRPSAFVDAAALRRWLRPQTLRTQFVLTEILRPPIALRESFR